MSEQPNARTLKKERTQKKILDAAIVIFAELGFEAASMATIAQRAGLKKALVQYHFETKDKLWKASVDALWQQLEQLANSLPQVQIGGSATEEHQYIRESFRQIIRFARENPAWIGIMFREASTPGPRLEWLIDQHLRKNIQDGVRFVELAQDHGLLPPGSPLHLIHIISGALTYILLVAPLSQQALGADLTSDESLDTTVDMLMTLLSPPGSAGNAEPVD